jgi:predicted DNA repair protein MutK
MASSLLVLLDDIATVMDDVAVLTKVATKKSAGLLGDDLALNAEQVTDFSAERELPVIWAVFKGALLNKAVLVPAALLLSAVAPILVTPLLMAGGLFLCYEGFEKVAHKLLHSKDEEHAAHAALARAVADPAVDMAAHEADKIKGAVRTDFILSAEIVAITLNAVAGASFVVRAGALTVVALGVTFFVYGLVAGLVKVDDLGRSLAARGGGAARAGAFLLAASPLMMKALSIAGTAAMFLVGGGILAHGLGVHAGPELLVSAAVGVAAGGAAVGLAALVRRVRARG